MEDIGGDATNVPVGGTDEFGVVDLLWEVEIGEAVVDEREERLEKRELEETSNGLGELRASVDENEGVDYFRMVGGEGEGDHSTKAVADEDEVFLGKLFEKREEKIGLGRDGVKIRIGRTIGVSVSEEINGEGGDALAVVVVNNGVPGTGVATKTMEEDKADGRT